MEKRKILRSNFPSCIPVNDKDGRFQEIKDAVIKPGSITIMKEDSKRHQHNLEKVLQSMFGGKESGLVILSSSMDILLNFHVDIRRPEEILFDMVLVISGQPATVMCIVDRPYPSNSAKEYSVHLTRALTRRVRRFTDENISFVYGARSEECAKDQRSLRKAFDQITEETSMFCNDSSLLMSKFKCEEIVDALLGAIGTDFLARPQEKGEEELVFFSQEEFSFLVENIYKDDILIPKHLVLLGFEILRRLRRENEEKGFLEVDAKCIRIRKRISRKDQTRQDSEKHSKKRDENISLDRTSAATGMKTICDRENRHDKNYERFTDEDYSKETEKLRLATKQLLKLMQYQGNLFY